MKLTEFMDKAPTKKKQLLFPSYAPPSKWRSPDQDKWLKSRTWRNLRQKILLRDDFTCVYCGFRAEKWQIVDHIDGDPENHSPFNLQVICQMCNLVKHSGMGCVIEGVVDLFKKADYPQEEIIKITRKMRTSGSSDAEIMVLLGLKEKVPFVQDRTYLKPLFAFVTSRPRKSGKPIF